MTEQLEQEVKVLACAMNALHEKCVLLGVQLDWAHGTINDEEFETIAAGYLKELTDWSCEGLVRALQVILKYSDDLNPANAVDVRAVLGYSIEMLEKAWGAPGWSPIPLTRTRSNDVV